MKVITRLLAIILALLFILVLPLSLLSFNVGRVLFNRPLLKTVLTDAVTDSDLVPDALAWFTQEVSAGLLIPEVAQQDLTAVLVSLTQEGWRAIRAEALSDDILAGWTSSMVDGFYTWLDSDEPLPSFTLDMQSFKARINSDIGLRTIEIAYNALPICGNDQVETFKSLLANTAPGLEVYYPPCQFPEVYKTSQLTAYLNSLTDVVNVIPDHYELQLQQTSASDNGWVPLKANLRLFRTVYWMGLILSLLLWGIVALLVIRTPRALARWGGIPLALAGALAIMLSWATSAFVKGLLITGPLQESSPELRTEMVRVISQLMGEMFTPMMVQALVILLIGGLMLVIIGGKMGKQPPKRAREGGFPQK